MSSASDPMSTAKKEGEDNPLIPVEDKEDRSEAQGSTLPAEQLAESTSSDYDEKIIYASGTELYINRSQGLLKGKNPFQEDVPADWSLMSQFDHRVYALQMGQPTGRGTQPKRWTEVVTILIGEGYFTKEQFIDWGGLPALKDRYEKLRLAFRNQVGSMPEPTQEKDFHFYSAEGSSPYDQPIETFTEPEAAQGNERSRCEQADQNPTGPQSSETPANEKQGIESLTDVDERSKHGKEIENLGSISENADIYKHSEDVTLTATEVGQGELAPDRHRRNYISAAREQQYYPQDDFVLDPQLAALPTGNSRIPQIGVAPVNRPKRPTAEDLLTFYGARRHEDQVRVRRAASEATSAASRAGSVPLQFVSPTTAAFQQEAAELSISPLAHAFLAGNAALLGSYHHYPQEVEPSRYTYPFANEHTYVGPTESFHNRTSPNVVQARLSQSLAPVARNVENAYTGVSRAANPFLNRLLSHTTSPSSLQLQHQTPTTALSHQGNRGRFTTPPTPTPVRGQMPESEDEN